MLAEVRARRVVAAVFARSGKNVSRLCKVFCQRIGVSDREAFAAIVEKDKRTLKKITQEFSEPRKWTMLIKSKLKRLRCNDLLDFAFTKATLSDKRETLNRVLQS